MKQAKKPLVIANWKMNLLKNQAQSLLSKISSLSELSCDIVISPPMTLMELASGYNLKVAAQDCSAQISGFGAYTGEVSGLMLKDVGCEYVIIGHSERRKYHHESEDVIRSKINNALSAGLIVILCVGESLQERQSNETNQIIANQLESLPENIDPAKLIIAYEPIWAIGTGKAATLDEINEVHSYIESVLQLKYASVLFDNKIKLVYGGSVKQDNAKDILSLNKVDGLLVGAASLEFDQFYQIVK